MSSTILISNRQSSGKGKLMDDNLSLAYTRCDCKYHVVFIPKYRRKVLFGQIGRDLGRVFALLARQKECRIESGSIQPDHVHMLISIPPKLSVSQAIGYIKGKSAIYIAKTYRQKARNFVGEHFWARGYFVSTVGKDEDAIRDYIQRQEHEDKRLDQLSLLE